MRFCVIILSLIVWLAAVVCASAASTPDRASAVAAVDRLPQFDVRELYSARTATDSSSVIPCSCGLPAGRKIGPPPVVKLGCMFTLTHTSADPSIEAPPYDRLHPLAIDQYEGVQPGLGPPVWAAFKWQLDRINNRSDILPRTKLVCDPFDDQRSPSRGFFGALELLQGDAKVIIGPSTSTASANAALAAARFDMLHLSYSATAAVLADRSQFPTFVRVCQSDAWGGYAMAHLAAFTFGWKEVAVLHSSDPYGSGGASRFVDAAIGFNVTVLRQVQFSVLATPAELVSPLQKIDASGARVILFFGDSRLWPAVSEAAAQLGMFNNQTAWFLSNSIDDSEISRDVRMRSPGLIALAPDAGLFEPEHQTWAAGFEARPKLDRHHVVEQFNGTVADVPVEAFFAVDALNVVATALHDLIERQGQYSFTPAQLRAQVLRTEIAGVTGPVSFDATGERQSLKFHLHNLHTDGAMHIKGTWDRDAYTPVLGASGMIVWADGTGNNPGRASVPSEELSSPDVPVYSALAYRVTVSIASLFLLLLLVVGATLYRFRHTHLVHASSPLIMSCIVVGCAMICAGVILSTASSAVACECRSWQLHIGFILTLTSICLKHARLDRIFNNAQLRSKQITDRQLFKIVMMVCCCDLALLAVQTATAPVRPDSFCERDGMSLISDIIGLLFLVQNVLLTFGAAVLSYRVRRMPSLYAESPLFQQGIFTVLLLTILWTVVSMSIRRGESLVLLTSQNILMLGCVLALLLTLFLPKLLDLSKAYRAAAEFRRLRGEAAGRQMKMMQLMKLPLHKEWKADAAAAAAQRSSALDSSSSSSALHTSMFARGPHAAQALPNAPKRMSDILQLLADVQRENEARMESLIQDSERLKAQLALKQRDMAATTETLFLIRSEMEFFVSAQEGMDLQDADVVQLFLDRMNEFAVPSGSGQSHQPAAAAAAAAAEDEKVPQQQVTPVVPSSPVSQSVAGPDDADSHSTNSTVPSTPLSSTPVTAPVGGPVQVAATGSSKRTTNSNSTTRSSSASLTAALQSNLYEQVKGSMRDARLALTTPAPSPTPIEGQSRADVVDVDPRAPLPPLYHIEPTPPDSMVDASPRAAVSSAPTLSVPAPHHLRLHLSVDAAPIVATAASSSSAPLRSSSPPRRAGSASPPSPVDLPPAALHQSLHPRAAIRVHVTDAVASPVASPRSAQSPSGNALPRREQKEDQEAHGQ